ncbi:hypothetical protein GCM10011492_40970 [Flexivirga endophytica]|uniref:Uncharacterized protein n=1 Tax=Flexivirga endophytica TaxID=1849103 RepID=A0A916TI52_9MICO|nr:hypothetical protein [Flexivirga endophytica]GGB45645.1 hypothetical protein GCM10011492_40970 [Flexivirga endophytica]GHB66385.1 hypothetical protein GCM10008112_39020 [Flexivirga endophytica]
MSHLGHHLLVTVLVLSTSVWLGGYVAIGIVARSATATMDPAQRVAFFRSLGRAYLRVGTPALVIGLVSGALLARDHPWDATLISAAIAALLLVVLLAAGVQQARRMTRLRHSALKSGDDPASVPAIRRGRRSAAILRAALGVLSLILVVLGCFMAG